MHNATCPCCQCGNAEDAWHAATDRVIDDLLLGLECRFDEWLAEQLAEASAGTDEYEFDVSGVLAAAKAALRHHLRDVK